VGAYSAEQRRNKLESICGVIVTRRMLPQLHDLVHSDAKLTQKMRALILAPEMHNVVRPGACPVATFGTSQKVEVFAGVMSSSLSVIARLAAERYSSTISSNAEDGWNSR